MIWDHQPAPFALGPWHLGPLPQAGLRWYTLAYLAGFYLAWRALQRSASRVPRFGPEEVGPATTLLIVSILLGARVGQVLLHQPLALGTAGGWRAMLDYTQPGMNFFGALATLGAALALFARRRGFNLWDLTDRLVIPLTGALVLGRLANWFTGEQYGVPTNGTWGCRFEVAPQHLVDGLNLPRHPVQLYAAAAALLLLLFLLWLSRREPALRPGWLTVAFLVGHGLLRLATEAVRQEDLRWGPFGCGQVLCCGLIVAGALLARRLARRR